MFNDPMDQGRKDDLKSQYIMRKPRGKPAWEAKYTPGTLLHLLEHFGLEAFKTDDETKLLCERLLRADRQRIKARATFVRHKTAKLEDLDGYQFHMPPMGAHQRLALSLFKHTRVMALFADCGLGKTYVLLHWIKYLQEHVDPGLRALVVAPLGILYDAWVDDKEKFGLDLEHCVLCDGTKKSIQKLESNPDADLVLVNFEKMSKLKDVLLEQNFGAMIIDESKMIANYKSQRTKACIALGDTIRHKAVASAIPAPNSDTEYWSQLRFLSQRVFGVSFSAFRSTYFIPQGYGGHTFTPNPRLNRERKEKMAQYSVVFRASECLDLPDELHHPMKVLLPPKVMAKYLEYHSKQMMKLKTEDGKSEIWSSRNMLTKLIHLREIAGGFIMKRREVYSEEKGKLVQEEEIRRIHDEKVLALKALVERIPDGEQIVVWAQFQEEFKMLSEAFPDAGMAYSLVPKKKRAENAAAFKAGDLKLLIAQPESYKYGFTWIKCHRVVWYSLGWSLDSLYQANKRVYRHGQVMPVHYYYLLGYSLDNVPTIDQMMLNRLNGKYQTQEEMLRDLMSLEYN